MGGWLGGGSGQAWLGEGTTTLSSISERKKSNFRRDYNTNNGQCFGTATCHIIDRNGEQDFLKSNQTSKQETAEPVKHSVSQSVSQKHLKHEEINKEHKATKEGYPTVKRCQGLCHFCIIAVIESSDLRRERSPVR